jgi:hypothetical protein
MSSRVPPVPIFLVFLGDFYNLEATIQQPQALIPKLQFPLDTHGLLCISAPPLQAAQFITTFHDSPHLESSMAATHQASSPKLQFNSHHQFRATHALDPSNITTPTPRYRH